MNKISKILTKITFTNFFYKGNKIILCKDNNYNMIKIKFSPFFIKAKNNNDIKIFSEKVKYFLTVLEQNCENFDSSLFLNNFKITIFNIKALHNNLKQGLNGEVILKEKFYFNIYTGKVINHELLHLSSKTKRKNYKLFTPFNEGYTQLMAERYFNENTLKGYDIETRILKLIETIIGKDVLEKAYFKGKLLESLAELCKYENELNLKNMVINFRNIFDLRKNETISFTEKNKKIQESLDIVINILFSCLKNKIKNIDELSEKLMLLNINDWCNSITYIDKNLIKEVNFLDKNIFIQYIQTLLVFNEVNNKKEINR